MAKLTTRDLGIAIRDHLEDHDIFAIDAEGETIDEKCVPVEYVDCGDANNLTVHMLNGQQFKIRIIAIA